LSSDVSSLKDLGGQSTHKRRGGNHQSLERVDRKVASGIIFPKMWFVVVMSGDVSCS